MRRDARSRIAAVVLAVGIGLRAALPDVVPATASGTVTVHLTITGGVRYSGTWRHAEDAKNDFCKVMSGGKDYTMGFNDADLNATTNGKTRKDLFTFSVDPYRKGKTRYTNNDDIALFVGLPPKRLYYNSGFPAPHMDIRIDANGLSGRLTGSGLTAYAGFSGNPIRVKATWSCSTLLRG